jgi:hypothetical protein
MSIHRRDECDPGTLCRVLGPPVPATRLHALERYKKRLMTGEEHLAAQLVGVYPGLVGDIGVDIPHFTWVPPTGHAIRSCKYRGVLELALLLVLPLVVDECYYCFWRFILLVFDDVLSCVSSCVLCVWRIFTLLLRCLPCLLTCFTTVCDD